MQPIIDPLNFLVLRTVCLTVEHHSISALAAHSCMSSHGGHKDRWGTVKYREKTININQNMV
jgi:hypothetical protein